MQPRVGQADLTGQGYATRASLSQAGQARIASQGLSCPSPRDPVGAPVRPQWQRSAVSGQTRRGLRVRGATWIVLVYYCDCTILMITASNCRARAARHVIPATGASVA